MGVYMLIGFNRKEGENGMTFLYPTTTNKAAIKAFCLLANITEEEALAQLAEVQAIDAKYSHTPEEIDNDYLVYIEKEKWLEAHPAYNFFNQEISVRCHTVAMWMERHDIDYNAGVTCDKVAIRSYLIDIGFNTVVNSNADWYKPELLSAIVALVDGLYWG